MIYLLEVSVNNIEVRVSFFSVLWYKGNISKDEDGGFILRRFTKSACCIMLSVVMAASLSGCSLTKTVSGIFDSNKKADTKKTEPKVTVGEYKEISLKTSDIDDAVQKEIDSALDNYATYDKIKSGKVKKGDTINIYYVGRVDGKTFEGGSCTKKDYPTGYDLKIGSGSFIPGFEDALIGKTIGTKCKIDVTFPDPYTQNTDLSGKDAEFTVTINSKQGTKHVPTVKKYVKKYATDYKDVDDYKASLRKEQIQELAWDAVYQASKVDQYDEDEVTAQIKKSNEQVEKYLSNYNVTLDDYLTQMNTTQEEFDQEVEKSARENIAKKMVYEQIANTEKLDPTDKEIQDKIESFVTAYGVKDESELDQAFQTNYGESAKSMISDQLRFEKVKTFLAGNVKESA